MNFLAPLAAFRSGPSALAQTQDDAFTLSRSRTKYQENDRADAINNSRRVVAERRKTARRLPSPSVLPVPANWGTGLTPCQRREARRVERRSRLREAREIAAQVRRVFRESLRNEGNENTP
jgi:hypothetical protein